MLIDVYNQKGEKVGKTELPSEIFGIEFNPDLVHQVVVSQMANKRKPIAHTKTREEVSGSGRKIWAQKHLGRARHGDIRAPIFRKGGVAHGPRKSGVW
jgi:large subunit ribosomal protein L4